MSLEPIDCTSHSREIEQEYLKIVRASDPDAKWLIISPNSQKEYYPSATGSDFSEFLDSFDDSKVQFGFARVSPPGSDVEKNILIGWCPDSAPMKTRASFASNFSTVANQVLKSYHVQVTARDSDDLDENELLMKISNAAGARYSIQSVNLKQATTNRRGLARTSASAGTNVKPPTTVPRTTPQEVSQQRLGSHGVQGNDNDDDNDEEGWNEPELKERDFNEQPLKPNQSSYKPIGKVDLQKVIAEETAREDPRLVHSIDAKADIAHLKEESRERRDRELESFIGSTKPPVVAPEFSRANRDDKVIKGFKTEKSPAQIWAERKAAAKEGKADTTSTQQEQPVVTATAAEKVEEEEEEEEPEERDVKDLKARFEQMSASNEEPVVITPKPYSRLPAAHSAFDGTRGSSQPAFNPAKFGQALPGMQQTKSAELSAEQEPEPEPELESEPEPEPEPERETENKASSGTMPVPLPPRHGGSEAKNLEEEEEEEEGEGEGEGGETTPPSLPRRNLEPQETPQEEEKEEEDESEEQTAAPPLPSRETQSAGSNAPPPPPRRTVEPEEPATPWAVAEYDYEAGEDNELTFNEGDKIINIEFVDDDWWLGELEKNGEKGLFPSNYVTLHK